MDVNVLKFVTYHEFFTDFYKVVLAWKCMYFVFIIYFCWLIIYLFPSFPKLLKLLKSCCLVRICLNIQLPGVFWASVNSLGTGKYLLYGFLLIFGVYVFDWL